MVTIFEKRYFISSLVAEASLILRAMRSHWGIENRLYWVLDMSYREDDLRIHRGDGAANLSVVRHIILNAFRLETSLKVSMKRKRLISSLDNNYLVTILDILFSEVSNDKGLGAV